MSEKKEHDFNAPIEKTSVELAKVVLKNFIDNFDIFVYEMNDETKSAEFTKSIVEKTTDFGIHTMALMATTDIPADYATYGIEKVIAGLEALKEFINGTLRQNTNELLSRTIGAKSPATNTYAKDCATLGDIMLALKKVRDSQGNNDADYFIPRKELSTEEVAVPENKE